MSKPKCSNSKRNNPIYKKKEDELQAKKTQDKFNDETKKKALNDKKVEEARQRELLVNQYLNTSHMIEDDGIDGRMVRQLISHGRKSKDSITYKVNANKNQQLKNQAQRDELYEQSEKHWWEQLG